ncbi:MAG: ATP synthase subunit delta [Parcubacteria group bacterium GW2011_GWC1_45_14]|nr:MAG: ATP synthase subunit delta [Parcubacteria group bacterium GW2011_GWC1_45_14]
MTKGKSQGEIDGIVSDFAKFLLKKRQAGKIGKIVDKFSQIWNKENKTVDCEILSVEKLEQSVLDGIKNRVKEKYQAQTVNVENRIDKDLKGGIVIRVGDEMLDASVSGTLFRLKKQLKG